MIVVYTVMLTFGAVCLAAAAAPAAGSCPKIITRDEWGAELPEERMNITEPTPYVALHHTYIPGYCSTTDDCKTAMKNMQNYHKNEKKWGDIGYSFCIGGDGNIYEGRGWGIQGAHTFGWNRDAIGVCIIGDYRTELPHEQMLERINELAECGRRAGHLAEDFKFFAHLQVSQTECPGKVFYDYIKDMPRWTPTPKKN